MWSFRALLYILLLLPISLLAQEQEAVDRDSLSTELANESVGPVIPILSSAAIVFDYGKLVGLVLDTETKYEIEAQIEIKNKLQLIGEYGIATLTPNGAYVNTNYTSEGYYYRVGLGYKVDMNTKNNMSFSVRYASSTYSDRGEIDIKSASGIYNDFVEPFDRPKISAYWYEAVLSSERRMWKGLYAGFHIRLRIMGAYDKQVPLDVFSIPGYGRTFDKSIPAFNLYVKYAFEWF